MITVVALEGPVNIRDAGGCSTIEGRTVRAGRLYRGDNPDRVSSGDADVLFSTLGIRSLVDLRNEAESDIVGDEAEQRGIRRFQVPLISPGHRSNPMLDDTAMDLGAYYRTYLDNGPSYVVAALRAVIEASGEPQLVHCAAGKDRTGVIVALVLTLLGVPQDVIVEDYHFTETRLPLITERLLAAHPEYAAVLGANAGLIMTAKAQTMRSFLIGLKVEQWCLDAGLLPEELERLREALLD